MTSADPCGNGQPGTSCDTFARACSGQVDNGRCADPGLLCKTAGSGCVGWISLYQDSGCGTPLLSTMIGDTEDCHDVGASGAQLGSMEGSWLMDDPGSCTAAGGTAVGTVVPEGPTVFCCQEPP